MDWIIKITWMVSSFSIIVKIIWTTAFTIVFSVFFINFFNNFVFNFVFVQLSYLQVTSIDFLG